MKKVYSTLRMLPLVAAAMLPLTAGAWGTPENPEVIYELNSEVASLKSARTPDGKTFISWLQWSEKVGWGYELRLQLLDADGQPMWEPEGIQVEDQANASWTADYWMVVTPEGDAIISWADARSEADLDERYGHESVLYKVSQDQEMLWGDEGILLGEQYKFPATLYQFGNDTYCIMQSSDSYSGPKMTRLTSEGEFEFEPKDFYGQLIASEGTDFISVYAAQEGTVAMRFNRDLEPVWDTPALVSTYMYEGMARNGYRLESDGMGGVVVSFSRNLGMFQHIPVVAYVTADGESVFGDSSDVLVTEEGDHNYNVVGVDPETETILSTWQMSWNGECLGGQLMDYYGERLWGDEGKVLAYKEGGAGYGYGPIAVYPLEGEKWFVVYADVLWYGNSILYFATIDAEGNQLSVSQTTNTSGIDDYWTYMVDGNFYMLYIAEYCDDDWVDHFPITTICIKDVNTGISGVEVDAPATGATEYYNISGQRLSKPAQGLNIVREADGTTRKVVIK